MNRHKRNLMLALLALLLVAMLACNFETTLVTLIDSWDDSYCTTHALAPECW